MLIVYVIILFYEVYLFFLVVFSLSVIFVCLSLFYFEYIVLVVVSFYIPKHFNAFVLSITNMLHFTCLCATLQFILLF